jgi:hypothetical protein
MFSGHHCLPEAYFVAFAFCVRLLRLLCATRFCIDLSVLCKRIPQETHIVQIATRKLRMLSLIPDLSSQWTEMWYQISLSSPLQRRRTTIRCASCRISHVDGRNHNIGAMPLTVLLFTHQLRCLHLLCISTFLQVAHAGLAGSICNAKASPQPSRVALPLRVRAVSRLEGIDILGFCVSLPGKTIVQTKAREGGSSLDSCFTV